MCSYIYWLIFLVAAINPCWSKQYDENLMDYLQEDDVGEYYYYAPSDDPVSCTRECLPNSPSRICYYRFLLEDYATMSQACENCTTNISQCFNPQCIPADGVERGMISVNRRLPGPSIQVCQGDRIVIDIINRMPARSTTIHFHGIFMKGTPYYDGVPMVTQCPIFEDTGFRYDFYANQAGTYYWHSHDGFQKVDGIEGSFIVRKPIEFEPNADLYDYDLPAHTLMFQDWFHTDAAQHYPGLVRPYNILDRTFYLINGRGRSIDPVNGTTTTSPLTVIRVEQGKRYRLRFIGAMCTHCPVRITIEGHKLTLIAADSNGVKPVLVDYLEFHSGERFDFVLNAINDIGSYWIFIAPLASCRDTYNYQLAVLQYEGSLEPEPQTPIPDEEYFTAVSLGLNLQNATCGVGQNGVCVTQLETIENFDPRVMGDPDINIPLSFGYYFPGIKGEFQNNTYHRYHHPQPDSLVVMYHMNHIYYQSPSSPVLSQREDIPEDAYCPTGRDGITSCTSGLCSCFNVIKIPLGAVVQLILLDDSFWGGLNHPFHLHGFSYHVMAMGYLKPGLETAYQITELMKTGELVESIAPVVKDTVAVPSEGYTVIRFVADNPGYWLFHCHFIYHHGSGMAVLLQVGEVEEIPPAPAGFPRCGNYFPPVTRKGHNKTSRFRGNSLNYVDDSLFYQ